MNQGGSLILGLQLDFSLPTANILSDGDIGVDISLTRSPVITATYLESHHKVGLAGGSGAHLPGCSP
jgi:hypothetical protein